MQVIEVEDLPACVSGTPFTLLPSVRARGRTDEAGVSPDLLAPESRSERGDLQSRERNP